MNKLTRSNERRMDGMRHGLNVNEMYNRKTQIKIVATIVRLLKFEYIVR